MTTTPDFQTLGAKIVELWDVDCDIDVEINELRELLSTPSQDPPTNDDLNDLWNWCGTADEYGHHEGNIFEYARAVLERWGK